MSLAARFALRYVGDSPNLSETLIHARLRVVRNRVVHDLTCPYCESRMRRSSLTGGGRRLGARGDGGYRCPNEHRVSLVPNRSGDVGWR